jgi:hypothetical protein
VLEECVPDLFGGIGKLLIFSEGAERSQLSIGETRVGHLDIRASVPAALEDFVRGTYLLSSDDDRPIGTLVAKGNRMWGVGPYYRRWGVEAGDHVVVTIDINKHQAEVVSGGEEVLLRFQEGE